MARSVACTLASPVPCAPSVASVAFQARQSFKTISAARINRARPRLAISTSACAAAAGGGTGARSAWVEKCLQRAQQTAILVDGVPYMPLAEAQSWFEAGEHEGDVKHREQLEAVMAERARLNNEMQHMAQAALKDHDAQDLKLRRLLNYAVALERELYQARKGMAEASLAAAHEAEERTLMQYQQALLEFEREHEEHEAEAHAVEASLRAEVKRLHALLHSAHGAKKQWREHALQVEAQFMQLRSLIEASLSQTAHEQSAAAAPPPLNTNPRIRTAEEVAPADAAVSVQHNHAPAAAGEAHKTSNARQSKGRSRDVRHQRGASSVSGESLQSL